MFSRSFVLAYALSIGYTSALSTGCTTQIAALALGDLGSCLQLTSLLPVLSTSGSIVTPINTYLGSLCSSSTPTCSNSTLSSAQSSINSSCSSDISGGGSDAAEIDGLLIIIQDYPEVYAAGCSKNTTTNAFCLTDTLTNVQNASGQNLSVSFLTSLLSGSSDVTSSLNSSLSSGTLCTGCVQGIYFEALKANASLANSDIGKALTAQCGANFGTNATTIATTSAAAATASATTSKSASRGPAMPFAGLGGIALTAASVLASVALGGMMVL